jgi:hypothetical protein
MGVTMWDIDGKPLGLALVGVLSLATGYIGGLTDWPLLALPASFMATYYLNFR